MTLPLSALCQPRQAAVRHLVLATIALLHFVHFGWTFSGPCRNRLPCKANVLQGDPSDCTVYWECSSSRRDFVKFTCDSGLSFDRKQKLCIESSVKCTRPCVPVDESGYFPNMENSVTNQTIPTTLGVPLVKPDSDLTTMENITEPKLPGKDELASVSNTTVKSLVITEAPEVSVNQTTIPASAAPEKQTTAEQPRPTTEPNMAATKETQTTAAPIVIEPVKSTPKPQATQPPYVVVTDAPEDGGTTRGNSSLIGPGGQAAPGMSGATIGIIAGVVVGVVILVVLVILIVCFLRRRKKHKEGKITRMENPQYSKPSREQNFRFSRDSALFVGPTVNLHSNGLSAMNNNSPSSDRRKRLAPPLPESPSNSSLGRTKRRAPPPPNPFTGEVEEDLYEKESQGSSVELTTFTARNDQASLKNINGNEEDDSLSKPTAPLVSKSNGRVSPEAGDSAVSSGGEEEVESPGAGDSPEQSLLNKAKTRSKDNMSVDSYDIEKNPFFED